MAISPDLQMMLLALDAYNRGGGEKLVVSFSTIGDYTVYRSENDGTYQSSRYRAGNGDRVLAFRGTDQLYDIIPGWLTGAGVPDTPQTRAALTSYEGVLADIRNDGGSGTLRLTGHSLGGGLAGLVAALRGGKEA